MSPVPYELRLPRRAESVPEAREFVGSVLRAERIEGDPGDLLVAVSEACTNVVNHAKGTDHLAVSVLIDDKNVSVDVSDTGPGFDFTRYEMPEPDDTGGRGLALMRLLCDDVAIHTGPDGTRIRLSVPRTSSHIDA